MKNLSGTSFDHRLESLEGRSLLSGAPADAGGGAAPSHEAAVVVADAGFLNAASDASDAKKDTTTDDSAMLDFGGAWGTQAAGQQVQQQVDLSGWAVDQDPGGSMPRITPADVSTVVRANFGHAAAFTGAAPVITFNSDPVVVDGPAADAPADAPIVNAPVTEVVAPPQPPLPAAPIAIAASASPAGIEWIEIPGTTSRTAHGASIAEQVVIASTFVAH